MTRNTYCRNCYNMYQSFTMSSEKSTVLSFFDKLISNFILPHKVKYLWLFKKLVTFRALCLCPAHGHTQSTAHTCVVFAQRHTHPRTSGFCSLRADLVLKEKKKITSSQLIQLPMGTFQALKGLLPVLNQSNPSLWLNHRPPGQTIKQDSHQGLKLNLPNYSILKHFL